MLEKTTFIIYNSTRPPRQCNVMPYMLVTFFLLSRMDIHACYSLYGTAVVEHGPHVLHLPATEFSHECSASAFHDMEHVPRGVLGVLYGTGDGGQSIVTPIIADRYRVK